MSFETPPKADEPLMSGEDMYHESGLGYKSSRSTKRLHLWKVLVIVTGCMVTFALGVMTGRNLPSNHQGMLAPEGNIEAIIEYNSTFGMHPSPESDAAWESLFPKCNGVNQHEVYAPEASGLVVYHNLRCLNTLRGVYYASLDGIHTRDMAEEHYHLDSPLHIRHCFDYLRQSLICSADTNLEALPKDFMVNEWRFTRTCRDLDAVKAWAEENLGH
ncbi:hypothetical protein N7520_008802 [Penicillium odoratum]|uniref:uncharacterized protein n=1 Tax=Penicillium odoratum TaxID=1167516 RepID=UPI002547D869|nr:uncharacterized protein N7520_008802 [Penicillium odoratum]KAJ5751885.1 hypothetical protein N7520_008802 [Penicillium odoratum]